MISPVIFDAIARQLYLVKEQVDAALNALELLRPMVGETKEPEEPKKRTVKTFGGGEREIPNSSEPSPDEAAAMAVAPSKS